MSVESVLSRIAAIESRMSALAASTAPRVAQPGQFASVMSAAMGSQVLAPAPRPTSWSNASGAGAASNASAPVTGTEKQLSPDQLNGILIRAGFTGDALRTAWAIAMRESSGQPGLVGPVNGNGTRDHGLFQFNDVHRGSWIDFNRVYDPEYAAEAAFRMSKGGTDFSAWALGDSGWAGQLKERAPETYQKLYGMWREFYDSYPTAVSAA